MLGDGGYTTCSTEGVLAKKSVSSGALSHSSAANECHNQITLGLLKWLRTHLVVRQNRFNSSLKSQIWLSGIAGMFDSDVYIIIVIEVSCVNMGACTHEY